MSKAREWVKQAADRPVFILNIYDDGERAVDMAAMYSDCGDLEMVKLTINKYDIADFVRWIVGTWDVKL